MFQQPFIGYRLLSRRVADDELWSAVRNACPDLSEWGEDTLRSKLSNRVGAILVEPDYICKDHRDLFSNYFSKKFRIGSPQTTRLHFFNDPSIDLSDLMGSPERFQTQYLGYSIIRPVAERCLGRTVIDPDKIGLRSEHTFCLRTPFRVHLWGGELAVNGFPYTSQDTDATVCAHAALWTVCRYLSERYTVYPEIHPYDLVTMCGSHSGRKIPCHGMSYEDYSTILSAFGAHPEILRVRKAGERNQDRNTFLDMAAYVESGFPVLASIGGHVVVLIGHTLDLSTRPKENNGFIESADYWKQLVVVDDNAFPYALFGKRSDRSNYQRLFVGPTKGMEDIITAVCPLPEKAYLPARIARHKLMKVARDQKIAALLRAGKRDPLVTRLLLTTSTSLKKRKCASMRHGSVPDSLSTLAASLALPHFVWLLQVAPVSVYKAGFATGEFVLDSTVGQMEDGILFQRVGNKAFIQGQTYDDPGGPTEFPLYTHNLGEHGA